MKISHYSFVLTLFFCTILYGYTANDFGIKQNRISAFYANFLDRFKTTGAIAPSSRFLAREITKNIAQERALRSVLHILEVGAGDGVFTAALVEQLEQAGVNYCIHAVDIDETFLAALRQRFGKNPRVMIHNVDILKATSARAFGLSPKFKFDVIVSGLPHYADFFSAQNVCTIFANYKKLLKNSGLLRWFSYVAAATFAELKHLLFGADQGLRLDFERKCTVIDAFKIDYNVQSSDPIMLNLPFARVYECRIFHDQKQSCIQALSPRRSPRVAAAVSATA